ncbi:MAG TPA: ROK family protein [Ferruginibacter sp.]|nr:ROK family protein [Ferruginibacter sp.]
MDNKMLHNNMKQDALSPGENVKESFYIGIDLGGTRIKGIALDAVGNVLHQTFTSTNDGEGEAWKLAIAATVNDLIFQLGSLQKLSTANISVGISAPGLPNNDNSAISFMPGRLEGLENFIWSDYLQCPCYVLNDGVAALLAEAKTGAAKESTNAVMVTLGTGVGGGLLINKQPYQGSFNKAGHIGHTVVDSNGDCDVTGMPGSLEECIGNCTVEKRSGGKFTSTKDLIEAAANGNEEAKKTWHTSVKKLAMALASASNFISPDTIVVGGGIAEANDALFVPLNKWFDEFEWQPGGIRPVIVKAMHADLAGAIGAACFAKQKTNEANK